MKWILIASLVFLLSCNDHSTPCSQYITPAIKFVGFDSTDFETYYIQLYDKRYHFDSLVSSTEYHYSINGAWTYFKNYTSSFFDPTKYNWEIKLMKNRVVQFGNVFYNDEKCDIHYQSSPCFCSIKHFTIETFNCTYSIEGAIYNQSIIISK